MPYGSTEEASLRTSSAWRLRTDPKDVFAVEGRTSCVADSLVSARKVVASEIATDEWGHPATPTSVEQNSKAETLYLMEKTLNEKL